ncbi:MAG: hypothetical protein K6F20_11995 [Bacteroidaceae bacterium]|nr:hypothetical protein [Bacteroidaceae bacterium]
MSGTEPLIQVGIGDFHIPTLKMAAREGRLFMRARIINEEEESREREATIIAYVSAIDKYVMPEYQSRIKRIWRELINHPVFCNDLVIKKGRGQGRFNRYMVTVIVCWMREMNIYRPDISAQDLHLIMEHCTRRNRYYTGMQNYTLNREQRKWLKKVKSEE